MTENKLDRLYERAMRIEAGQELGRRIPILYALARRRHAMGMLELACWFDDFDTCRWKSAFRLQRQAWKMGCCYGAQHIAMNCFNRKDLAGYRKWLRRAVRAGDGESGRELRCFETRKDSNLARQIGRGRPTRKHESMATRRPY